MTVCCKVRSIIYIFAICSNRPKEHPRAINYKHWICASPEAKVEMETLLRNNKNLRDGELGYIGRVPEIYNLDGKCLTPDQYPSLQGAIVEVAAFISHDIYNINRVRTDNYFADLSYMTVLKPAPPPPNSPAKSRGFLQSPDRINKKQRFN